MNTDVLVDKLNLKRVKIRGYELMASCPFTERHLKGTDKTPSFSINIDKGVFNCFSCGSRGTIEELLAYTNRISMSAACELLTEIGFDRLSVELHKKEIEEAPEVIPEGILFYFDKVENEFVELYSGEVDGKECLLYPVRRVDGKLVGALARSKEDKWHKVLWNMKKKNYLYGEDRIIPEELIVIVEGPGDVLAIKQSGINNVVALMGIIISDEQVRKLLLLSSSFVVWLDKDLSGAKGMNSLMKKMEKRALMRYVDPWKIEEIETKQDAKFIFEKFGPEKVKEIINNSKTLLEHIMEKK